MATVKLNLAMEEGIVERMKMYATERHSSVSKIAESYFALLTNPKAEQEQRIPISPLIESLGIDSIGVALPADFDADNAIADYLEEKYR